MSYTPAQVAELSGMDFAPGPQQESIIAHPMSPLLVVAGAGAGKTATIAARAVYLAVNQQVEPGRILGLTFTRKAALEMRQRIIANLATAIKAGASTDSDVKVALQKLQAAPPTVTTYNAFAGQICRDYGLRIGIDPQARLITEAERWQIMNQIVMDWKEDLNTTKRPSSVVSYALSLAGKLIDNSLSVSQAKEELLVDAADILDSVPAPRKKTPYKSALDLAESLRVRAGYMDLVQAYEDFKKANSLMDFADQIGGARRIVSSCPDVRDLLRLQYQKVFLDEFQDTSANQIDFLSDLFAGHPVTAVGDPNQAIYEWRGASRLALDSFAARFAPTQGAQVKPLTTAWRNPTQVLQAANISVDRLAVPAQYLPKTDFEPVNLPKLTAAPGAKTGAVLGAYFATDQQEAEALAEWFAKHWNQTSTAAVLCRNRASMPLIYQELTKAGVQAAIIGAGGLIESAGVADLIAALAVAHDGARGDAMMRLLNANNLGATDISALWAAARSIAREVNKEGHPDAYLAEAVEALRLGRKIPDLSATGQQRVLRLAQRLAAIRALLGGSLNSLLHQSIQIMDLDLDVALHGEDSMGALSLSQFLAIGAEFASRGGTLEDFLSWLEAAATEERGISMPEVPAQEGVVQILTIHAAKGLEWDSVAVVALSEGVLPGTAPRKDGSRASSRWLTDQGELPASMRADAVTLPNLQLFAGATHKDVDEAIAELKKNNGEADLIEDRRLVYVAFTRAKQNLLVTGAALRGSNIKPAPPSMFFTELVKAEAIKPLPGVEVPFPSPAQLDELVEESPRVETEVLWPPEQSKLNVELQRLGKQVASLSQSKDPAQGISEKALHWAKLLVAESRQEVVTEVKLPRHMAATTVQKLGPDLAMQLRRPVPTQPSDSAYLGTLFHAWVEALLSNRSEPPVADLDEDALKKLHKWQHNWKNFDFLRHYQVIEAEAERDIIVSGVRIIARIDAVMQAKDSGRVHIMDWKTGRVPVGENLDAAKVQLELYRLAWAKSEGIDPADIDASLVYVNSGKIVSLQSAAWTSEQVARIFKRL